jgi:hypothetical protein
MFKAGKLHALIPMTDQGGGSDKNVSRETFWYDFEG